MISAKLSQGTDRLLRSLAARARKVASARIAIRARAARKDPSRWRDARLLWPDLTKD